MTKSITIKTIVNAPIEKVWERWNGSEHIPHWAFASDDWEAPWAKNDLKVGGELVVRMQAKGGAEGFDLKGIYDAIEEPKLIEYHLEDGRRVVVQFQETADGVEVIETFQMEDENPEDMQRQGWQAILNNFKKYAEA